jgi:hypothetical protein
LAEDISDLVGIPLAEVAEVDFQIRISEIKSGRWHLHVDTVDQKRSDGRSPTARGSRDIDGATCAEVVEAATLTVAVSIRSLEATSGVAAPLPRPAPPASVREAPPVPLPNNSPEPVLRPAVALALTTDAGALPSARPGLELDGTLGRGPLRLTLLGAWFASADAVAQDGSRGTFQLAIGAALACFAPHRGRWTPLVCGGFELGRLAGTGLDVPRPKTGATLWRAARGDAGLMAALGGNLSVVLRAGVAIPLTRPEFALDGTDIVYQPSRLALHLTGGVELSL